MIFPIRMFNRIRNRPIPLPLSFSRWGLLVVVLDASTALCFGKLPGVCALTSIFRDFCGASILLLALLLAPALWGQEQPADPNLTALVGDDDPQDQESPPRPDTRQVSSDAKLPRWENSPRYGDSKLTRFKVEEIVEPMGEYRFSGFGRVSPFEAPPMDSLPSNEQINAFGSNDGRALASGIVAPGANSVRTAEIPIINPLQKYSLAKLTVKGIVISGDGRRKALIMTPSQEGIVVKAGDPISAGKVMDIQNDRILVRQYSLRKDGAREFKDSEMFLGDHKESKPSFISLIPGGNVIFESQGDKPIAKGEPSKLDSSTPQSQNQQIENNQGTLGKSGSSLELPLQQSLIPILKESVPANPLQSGGAAIGPVR